MPQLVKIIRKGNEHLAQDGDEIELDIEALDTETLWELDRVQWARGMIWKIDLKKTMMRMWTLTMICMLHTFLPWRLRRTNEVEKLVMIKTVVMVMPPVAGTVPAAQVAVSHLPVFELSFIDSDWGSSSGSDSDADDVQS
ncbi:unnamed protein product [Fraxinus pennsylvanica]|uniref:NET domain-containing protein n=1 Tax=Fraxinus pennsylvanica TaxID=56036 RepID=A0AAD1ZKU7_9LAMI|nr:unnamed protein product [Fraxinus pennsylvanica]